MSKPQDEIAIKVEHLTKSFKIPLESSNGLKQKLINTIKGRKGYRTFTPLNDISFEIKKGEFFGIVGRNGSGKSTLLKSIAGIYTIESGKVSVNGTLVPFIELGVGFNAELTGRENVYLNGALLGFSNSEMAAMYDEIVDFAELHDFMEERLKNYSSGMQVRLAFSIAIRAKGDVLLLDEVLAVGDAAFQQKCYDYFEELKRENRTIVLVTHSMEAVKRFCSSALLLENGNIKLIGTPEEVADQYIVDNIQKSNKKTTNSDAEIESKYIDLLEGSIDKVELNREQSLLLNLTYKLKKEINPMVGMSIISAGRSIAELNSIKTGLSSELGKMHKVEMSIPMNMFNPGLYSVNISIFKKETRELIDYKLDVGSFVVEGNDQSRGGVIYLPTNWKQHND